MRRAIGDEALSSRKEDTRRSMLDCAAEHLQETVFLRTHTHAVAEHARACGGTHYICARNAENVALPPPTEEQPECRWPTWGPESGSRELLRGIGLTPRELAENFADMALGGTE